MAKKWPEIGDKQFKMFGWFVRKTAKRVSIWWDYDGSYHGGLSTKISPMFATMKDLKAWWIKNRNRIVQKEFNKTGEK